jgi:integrase
MSGKELRWERRRYRRKGRLSDNYEDILLEFETAIAQSLSPGALKNVLRMTREFLSYLEGVGVKDLRVLMPESVIQFVISASSRLSHMGDTAWALKRFCSFLDSCGVVKINASAILANPAPRRQKVLPCFTMKEIEAFLTAIDTSTALGKRDYAIVKTALGTGLRGVDIFGLQLSDIDWHKNEIKIVQSKTDAHLALPLMADVGNAIADYILNARPQSGSPHLFLRHKKPHVRLSSGAGVSLMKRYREIGGLSHESRDGKTFHAFRRTVGLRLIKAEISLPDTAQILGHRNIESTKRYLPLNDDMLRVCCLDISAYATKKEGLA